MLNFNKKEKEYLLSLLKADAESDMAKKLAARIERSMAQIKPASAKRKGQEWQKECCRMIADATGIPYDSASDVCEIRSRESAAPGVDIILSGEAAKLFPWKVECKNAKTVSLPEWIRQAMANSGGESDWLLLVKSEALPCKKIAVMDFAKFGEISRQSAVGSSRQTILKADSGT